MCTVALPLSGRALSNSKQTQHHGMSFEREPRDTVLVALHSVIPDLLTDVRYATADNFTGRVLYSTDTLYARRAVADALLKAQDIALTHNLQLKVYDAYRPLSIQRFMWSIVPDERYVADPAKGSRHNRGCALDLTLCNAQGKELEMGTGYDEFTEKAASTYTDLPEHILNNRGLLTSIMKQAGFTVLPSEWWHFDLDGWEQFAILNE